MIELLKKLKISCRFSSATSKPCRVIRLSHWFLPSSANPFRLVYILISTTLLQFYLSFQPLVIFILLVKQLINSLILRISTDLVKECVG